MVETVEKTDFGKRLEDFIELAAGGKDIQLTVELKKQPLKQRVHPEETQDQSSEIDMYLFIGLFECEAGEKRYQVSKTYMFSALEESASDATVNRKIANARLAMDYQRLKAANIEFEEKYF